MSFQVPLISGPQTFPIVLGSTTYQFTFIYRNADQGGWILDIDDDAGNPLVHGIPLVTGTDLLSQYAYLGFSGSLYCQTLSDPDAVPTFENLGTDGCVFWIPK